MKKFRSFRNKKKHLSSKYILLILTGVCIVALFTSLVFNLSGGPLNSVAGYVFVPMQKGINNAGSWISGKANDFQTLGEVLKEKRPCTAWGFTTLDNQHIICQVTGRKWEIIEAETLEVKETFTHKEFTGNHTDFCINHISLCENGNVRVAGFQNVWDDSEKPPKMLPNIEFEYLLKSSYFEALKNNS